MKLTAKEAREMTDKVIKENTEVQLKNIEALIRKAIKKEQYYTMINEDIRKENLLILEELGYKVEKWLVPNSYKVSWKDDDQKELY